MPRVHTAKAGKDYPAHDIKKGETYYHWAFFRGPKQMSKTRPRRSQTTGSGKLSNVYAAEEEFEDACAAAATPEDLTSACDDAVTAAEACEEEYQEAIDNLENGFPNGCPALEETQEALDKIGEWKSSIEDVRNDINGLDASEFKDDVEDKDKNVDGYDDLGTLGQGAMMDAARDIATNASLDL